MVECEFDGWEVVVEGVISFNRYMVECECFAEDICKDF